eukprot:982415-Prymnesium_polylepis.1
MGLYRMSMGPPSKVTHGRCEAIASDASNSRTIRASVSCFSLASCGVSCSLHTSAGLSGSGAEYTKYGGAPSHLVT